MSFGIDLGTSSIKVVELRRGLGKIRVAGMSRKRVAHLRASEYPHMAPRVLGEVIAGRSEGARAVLGITGRDINLQIRVFPASKMTSYAQMMRNEINGLRQEQPDLYVDYATLRGPDAYYPKYLSIIGMGKNSFVDERVSIANAAGVRSTDVIPTPFALYAAYARSYPGEGGVVMLLNIGADNTDLVLVRGGRLIFARNISQGAKLFDDQIRQGGIKVESEAEFYKIKYGSLGAEGDDPRADEIRPAMRQGAWQLVGMLKSSLTYAKNQLDEPDLAVDHAYVAGGGAKIPGLLGYLKSALNTPVDPLDPFKSFDTTFIRQSGENEATAIPSDMAIATGLAILGLNGARNTSVSLLPDRVRERRNARRTVPFLIAAIALFVVTLGVVTVSLRARAAEEQSQATAMRAERESAGLRVDQLDNVEKEYRREYAKLDTLQTLTASSKGILNTYHRLRLLYRDGVQIENIEVKDAEPVRRVIGNMPDKGHLAGTVAGETEEKFTLVGGGEVPKASAYAWEVTVPKMTISGEVDENVKEGPHGLLDDMAKKITDAANRVTCTLDWQGPSEKRPGWRSFRLVVRFE